MNASGIVLVVGVLFGTMADWQGRMALAEQETEQDYPRPDEKGSTQQGGVFATLSTWKVNGEVEAGGQTLSGSTGSPTLQEYRDLSGKPTIPKMFVHGEDPLGSKFFEFGGKDMTRTDASYFLQSGSYNNYRFDFNYDRQPHTIGLNRSMIFADTDLGNLLLTSSQCNNVATFNDPPGTTPAQRNAIEGSVTCLSLPTPVGHQTDTALIGLSGTPFPDTELKLTYTRKNKEGTRPFGGFIGTAGSPVTEFAAPRDELIQDVSAGVQLNKDWYQVGLTYDFSLFQNSVNQIQWQNVCGTGAACGNPSALGRLAPMPDNTSNTFAGTGGMSLPWWQTRLAGSLSYSLWRQDETFLPTSTIPGSGNTNDAGANSPNAKMNVLLTNLNLTSRPVRDVTLLVRYRYYDLVNNTPMQSFTGTLRPGDSAVNPSTVTTLPIAFRRQNVTADTVWQLAPKVTAKAGYEWEHWGRSFREVANLSENIGKASVNYRPRAWITTGVKYSYGVRTIGAGGYVPMDGNAVSLPQLRMFDQADRTRNKGEVFLQSTPIETLTVSGSFYGQHDNYRNSAYGILNSTAYGYTVDLTWTLMQDLSVFAGYVHDDYQSLQQNCNIAFNQVTCDPANNFMANPRDILETLHGGFAWTAIPALLDFNVEYRYTYGRSKFGMAGSPTGTAAAQPAPMPNITNITHTLNISSRYRLTPQWTLKLHFMYERYTESDWTVDNVTNSLANLVVEGFTTTSAADVRSVVLPIQHPNYEAYFTAFSLAYRF
ncbi:MAG TPA: MtrB/PioB family decaheme-associated outer membrane protein [Nitrospira sp.]|nr:MtrB/PioB family decaheme-associated outer membrane protein [Nitrospira sp.]